jgi:hypothetical protein
MHSKSNMLRGFFGGGGGRGKRETERARERKQEREREREVGEREREVGMWTCQYVFIRIEGADDFMRRVRVCLRILLHAETLDVLVDLVRRLNVLRSTTHMLITCNTQPSLLPRHTQQSK